MHQVFHGSGAMVSNLEEDGAPPTRHSGQHARNVIVDELSEQLGLYSSRNDGIEHLQKMPQPFLFGFDPEIPVSFEGPVVGIHLIVKGYGVKCQVGSTIPFFFRALDFSGLDLFDGDRSKGSGRGLTIAPAANDVNVGRVIGADCHGHRRIVEDPLLQR